MRGGHGRTPRGSVAPADARRANSGPMTTYVALLRGINVGGKAKVDMPTLRALFGELGCADVATYINSGNVLFRGARAPDELVRFIEAAVAERFGIQAAVQLRDLPAMRSVCDAIPAEWANDARQKTDVLFLGEEIDTPDLLESVAFDPAVENVLHVDGALVWNIDRERHRRGNSVKLVGTDLYRRMTVRNVNTVRRLRELMEGLG